MVKTRIDQKRFLFTLFSQLVKKFVYWKKEPNMNGKWRRRSSPPTRTRSRPRRLRSTRKRKSTPTERARRTNPRTTERTRRARPRPRRERRSMHKRPALQIGSYITAW